jgi:hypothetical protein
MTKKAFLRDVEILTAEDDASAQNLLKLVEAVIGRIESELDRSDENFHVHIEMEVAPNRPLRHCISSCTLTDHETSEKVLGILEKATNTSGTHISGIIRFDLQVEEG